MQIQKSFILLGFALLIVLAPLGVAQAQGALPPVPPAPVGENYIVDQLGWLNADQAGEINTIVTNLDREGLAEIAILTTTDCGDDYKRYRYEVFNTWGVGHANDNDGLLIAVCWGEPGKRNIEQEPGYGMEGTLPDLLLNKVVKEVYLPYQTAKRNGDGLVAMVRTYNEIIRGGSYESAMQNALQPLKDDGQYVAPETKEMTSDEAWALLFATPFMGLTCGIWIIIAVVLFFAYYFYAISQGWIKPGTGNYTGGNDGGNDSPSSPFGGGDSGGGGASTNIG
ncbi:MAG: hypothetical protein COU63_01390 [Candidatus Pacebacteria bacterium CG10_big_fil_rev_8_21_14_0_10_36_11]|nr:TPM domain-containing protein [Candidatus Pacearchaeota archaeon]OIP73759.1 MAG: hypothetical protein AUK08_04330 [Candidatus Pacebacteria bacterium CG2_30_36_39]PIR64656.1 MAG: hypothetical protein COU63_01390 [Candidatus Pacebacteria bacterium CG10_big_fil_rev_8_21_14_0_10_36_11]